MVYNGVAKVADKEKTEEIDYYVSYEAKEKAGIVIIGIDVLLVDVEEQMKLSLKLFLRKIIWDLKPEKQRLEWKLRS